MSIPVSFLGNTSGSGSGSVVNPPCAARNAETTSSFSRFSTVQVVAVAAGIPVFQPENFREEETVEQLRALQPDICAVVAYGRILPQKVLDVPKYGLFRFCRTP